MSTLFPYVLVNGHPSHNISVFDRGFCYGDGVFETMAYVSGQIPLWQWHSQRLLHSCGLLSIPVDITCLEAQFKQVFDYALKHELQKGIVKLTITRGEGGRGYIPPTSAQPNIVLSLRPQEPMDDEAQAGVLLSVCEHRLSHNVSLAGIKHLNRLDYIVAGQELSGSSTHYGVLLDVQGFVVETMHHNIFAVRDQQLVTPMLDRCGVNGVLRRYLIEVVAPKMALEVKEISLTLEDFLTAEEAFITNAVKGVVSVKQCNNTFYTEKFLTKQLQNHINPLLGLI